MTASAGSNFNSEDLESVMEGWIERFGHVLLSRIPVEIRVIVARRFQPIPDLEWTPLAFRLGIQDQQTINEIKGDAYAQMKWPSEVLLMDRTSDVLSELTFGQLLNVLLEMNQKKVLMHLLDCQIEDLLVRMDKMPNPNNKLKVPRENVNSARPFLFLTYSADATDIATQLTSLLHKENIGVLSEAVLVKLDILQRNPTAALQYYINQVPLVVPIISKQYLKNVKSPPMGTYERFIYELYTRNFTEDGCLNHKVRTVVAPKKPNREVMKRIHPVLDPRWYLWDQWDVFLEVVRAVFRKNKMNY